MDAALIESLIKEGIPDAEVRIESLDELVEFFTAAGKKGVAISFVLFTSATVMNDIAEDEFLFFSWRDANGNYQRFVTVSAPTDPITFEQVESEIEILGLSIPSFNEWLYYLCWTIALALFGRTL